MMFKQNFVCAVKVNGKILREQSNLVTLPFGSEYTILLKNLNSRRAMVKVSVDSRDATEDTRLILQPNATLELERFIRNGNLTAGNRFKFIERTASIEGHRGIGENDGLIRAEFWAEQEVIDQPIVRHHYYDEWHPVPRPYYPPCPRRPWWDNGIVWNSQNGMNVSCSVGSVTEPSGDIGNVEKCARGVAQNAQMLGAFNMASNDAGITVPGSESQQRFHNVSGFPLESSSHVIVLQLRGEIAGKPVEAPVTVDVKPQCSTCGKTNKAGSRFCGQCGTALELV